MIKICFSHEITGLCQLLFIKTIAAYTSFGNYFTFELLLWSVFSITRKPICKLLLKHAIFFVFHLRDCSNLDNFMFCFKSITCLITALKPRKTINWQILYSVIYGQFCLVETYTKWIMLSFTMVFLKRL